MKKTKETKITKRKASAEVMRLASSLQYDEALEMVKKYNLKNLTVTRQTLQAKYRLTSKEIESLHFVEVENPHFKTAGKMKLYLRAEAYRSLLKKRRANEENSKLNK